MLENVKKQLILLAFGSTLFFALTLLIIFFTDPFKITKLIFFLFYFCLSLFSISFLALILYFAGSRFSQGLYSQRFVAALRQALFLTILLVGLLILSSKQLLYWWIGVIFAITLILIEMFFLI